MADDEASARHVDDVAQVPGTPPAAGSTAVVERLAAVEEALAALSRRVDAGSERAAARERVIDRQHADIERLRADERGGVLRPVVTDLCRLRNDLLRQSVGVAADVSAEQVVALLESYAASVEDALLRCGVEVLPRELDAPFTPRCQQVARVVEVDDPLRDGTVAEVVADGYAETDGGRVVLAARVVVRRRTSATHATREHADA